MFKYDSYLAHAEDLFKRGFVADTSTPGVYIAIRSDNKEEIIFPEVWYMLKAVEIGFKIKGGRQRTQQDRGQ